MEISHIILFASIFALFLFERLIELRIARRNFEKLRTQGGMEFGAEHYPAIVLMHTMFFISLVVEFILCGEPLAPFFIVPLTILILAQILRGWTFWTMRSRWTTRIIVVPGERLIISGPFRFFRHPNYFAVAMELFAFPLLFGLYYTCILFSILNAAVLLLIRIPTERRALVWSQTGER